MPNFTRYPVINHGAEYLVMGYLMRRNILTYKAPPNNEGYDLICIHPDPRRSGKPVRVQVKSRLATDADRGFLVRESSLDAFDYLIIAFLNVGYFHHKRHTKPCRAGLLPPEFYTLPPQFVREHLSKDGDWEKVRLRGLNLDRYRGAKGFEQIARRLRIEYPEKNEGSPSVGRKKRSAGKRADVRKKAGSVG